MSNANKTDLATLRALLTKAKIVYYEERNPDIELPANCTHIVSILAHDSQQNLGYYGFFAEWYFDCTGALLATGMWE